MLKKAVTSCMPMHEARGELFEAGSPSKHMPVNTQLDMLVSLYLVLKACLIGTKAFGVNAVTLATDAGLPVEEGGLGDSIPLGELPAVLV